MNTVVLRDDSLSRTSKQTEIHAIGISSTKAYIGLLPEVQRHSANRTTAVRSFTCAASEPTKTLGIGKDRRLAQKCWFKIGGLSKHYFTTQGSSNERNFPVSACVFNAIVHEKCKRHPNSSVRRHDDRPKFPQVLLRIDLKRQSVPASQGAVFCVLRRLLV